MKSRKRTSMQEILRYGFAAPLESRGRKCDVFRGRECEKEKSSNRNVTFFKDL